MNVSLDNIAEIRLISLAFICGVLLFQPSFFGYLYQFIAIISFLFIALVFIGNARGFLLLSIFFIGVLLSFLSYRSHDDLQKALIPTKSYIVTIENKSITSNEWQAVYSLNYEGNKFKMYSQFDKKLERGDRVEVKISKCKLVEYPKVTYCTGKVTSTLQKGDSSFEKARLRLQEGFYRLLGSRIGPRPAGLALGMILGVRSFVLSSDSRIFQESGLVHILVASGANIIFLTNLVGNVLTTLKCGIRWKNLSIMLVLFIYAWFIGPEVPIVRASIMVFFLMLGNLLGRPINQVNGLLLAVTIMLALDPSLVYNASFQLTVAGVVCIICGNKLAQIFKLRNLNSYMKFLISEVVIMPLMVILIMGPLLIYRFQSMNIVGVLVSPLSLIFVEWLTIGIIPILIISWIAGSQIIASMVGICIIRFVDLIKVVSSLPSLSLVEIRGYMLLIYYSSLYLSAITTMYQSDNRRLTAIPEGV